MMALGAAAVISGWIAAPCVPSLKKRSNTYIATGNMLDKDDRRVLLVGSFNRLFDFFSSVLLMSHNGYFPSGK